MKQSFSLSAALSVLGVVLRIAEIIMTETQKRRLSNEIKLTLDAKQILQLEQMNRRLTVIREKLRSLTPFEVLDSLEKNHGLRD